MDPPGEQGSSDDGFDADDDHPEVPVEPARGEARPVAQRHSRVLGE